MGPPGGVTCDSVLPAGLCLGVEGQFTSCWSCPPTPCLLMGVPGPLLLSPLEDVLAVKAICDLMICVLPGLVVGALGSQSQSLCPVILFMMAGYRAGDTRLNSAVSPSHAWTLPLSSLWTWDGAVPQMWRVVLFISGPHSIMRRPLSVSTYGTHC